MNSCQAGSFTMAARRCSRSPWLSKRHMWTTVFSGPSATVYQPRQVPRYFCCSGQPSSWYSFT